MVVTRRIIVPLVLTFLAAVLKPVEPNRKMAVMSKMIGPTPVTPIVKAGRPRNSGRATLGRPKGTTATPKRGRPSKKKTAKEKVQAKMAASERTRKCREKQMKSRESKFEKDMKKEW